MAVYNFKRGEGDEWEWTGDIFVALSSIIPFFCNVNSYKKSQVKNVMLSFIL